MIKISIIVPIYKVPEHFLRQSIESLINQSMKEIEIILVDDGSPDNCGEICDEYKNKDKRVVVIHKENGGLAAARNSGFNIAKGEWITFVDGDDWLDRETCEVALRATDKETEMVFWTRVKEYPNRSVECLFKKGVDNKRYIDNDCKDLQVDILDFNSNIATAYAKLIRKDFLLENKILHDETLRQGAEGIDFNIRVFEKIRNVIFLNKPFYHYIFNEESISAKHDEKNHYYVINCFKKIRDFIEMSKNKEKLLEKYYERLIYVLITTAISGYFSPINKEPFVQKKRKFYEIQNMDMFKEALENVDRSKLSKARRITLLLIENKLYLLVQLIAYARRFQLKNI